MGTVKCISAVFCAIRTRRIAGRAKPWPALSAAQGGFSAKSSFIQSVLAALPYGEWAEAEADDDVYAPNLDADVPQG